MRCFLSPYNLPVTSRRITSSVLSRQFLLLLPGRRHVLDCVDQPTQVMSHFSLLLHVVGQSALFRAGVSPHVQIRSRLQKQLQHNETTILDQTMIGNGFKGSQEATREPK